MGNDSNGNDNKDGFDKAKLNLLEFPSTPASVILLINLQVETRGPWFRIAKFRASAS
jgi:hypothetical protein